MKTILNRMCWNSRGWRIPTGNSSDGGYPSETGYGHEEWNFQVEDAYNGNIYGYTYYRPPETTIEEAEGHFKIGFWSRHPGTKLKLLVGIYHDATVVSNDETNELYNYFNSEGILNRRAEELESVANYLSYSEALAEVKKSVNLQWINWKCPIEKVEIFPHLHQLTDKIGNKTIGAYFTKPTFVDTNLFIDSIKVNNLIQSPMHKIIRNSPLTEDAYYRESARNLRVIIPRHNQLSNKFCKWLKSNGAKNIKQEQNQVDVSFETSKGTYLAELKVCFGVGTTKSIREALGQLFEYNFYSWRKPAKHWIIILDENPSNEDREYLIRITKAYSLPIIIGWESNDEFIFHNNMKL